MTQPTGFEPVKPTLMTYLKSVYAFRHLIAHLARADLRNRFRRSYLGVLWLLVNPLVYTCIFVIIFGAIFNISVREYAPYVLSGIVLWEFISNVVGQSTQSILSAEGYLRQKRIPLFAFCLRTLIYHFVCLLAGLAAVLVVVTIARPGLPLMTLPWLLPAMVLLVVFAAPIGVISAVAHTRFRDYQVVVGHLLMIGYYISPVFIIRKEFDRPGLRVISDFNPITSICDLFRDPLLYGRVPELQDMIVVLAWAAVFWAIAIFALKRTEPDMIFHF
ncbi:ABC transporter permease [Boseaceae bacterium BT-24-1]|nr:ABC transporter permease [Boseaceae bacterium BT-24-1]